MHTHTFSPTLTHIYNPSKHFQSPKSLTSEKVQSGKSSYVSLLLELSILFNEFTLWFIGSVGISPILLKRYIRTVCLSSILFIQSFSIVLTGLVRFQLLLSTKFISPAYLKRDDGREYAFHFWDTCKNNYLLISKYL